VAILEDFYFTHAFVRGAAGAVAGSFACSNNGMNLCPLLSVIAANSLYAGKGSAMRSTLHAFSVFFGPRHHCQVTF
jgi:hypothetical protein